MPSPIEEVSKMLYLPPPLHSSVGPEYVVHFPSLTITSSLPQEHVIPLGKECVIVMCVSDGVVMGSLQ